MDLGEYAEAYEAYQQALYRDGRCNTIWLSTGLLYYQINKYRDCLDCLSRSVRLYPYELLVWRDLGVLVSSTLNGGHRI